MRHVRAESLLGQLRAFCEAEHGHEAGRVNAARCGGRQEGAGGCKAACAEHNGFRVGDADALHQMFVTRISEYDIVSVRDGGDEPIRVGSMPNRRCRARARVRHEAPSS